MPQAPYRGRFAPSPTGDLHAGSLVAALASWLRARRTGGQWLVRMEDIDPPREVPGSAQAIVAELERLGLAADGPVLYQSTRGAAYAAALESLRARGAVFPCWCSRADLAATDGLHRDGHCVAALDPARVPAWRLRVTGDVIEFDDVLQGHQQQDLRTTAGDFVLRRADGLWAYQLACVVDDAAQGITEVVRGADLLDSTARQIHLQRLLGLPTPRYLHIPLVTDADGRKLSKSDADQSLATQPAPLLLRTALGCLGVPDTVPATATVDDLLESGIASFDVMRLAGRPRLTGPLP